MTIGDMLEDNSMEETQNELVESSLHAEVEVVLGKLNPRESGILRMRYGLDDGQPKTLEDIGNAFQANLSYSLVICSIYPNQDCYSSTLPRLSILLYHT